MAADAAHTKSAVLCGLRFWYQVIWLITKPITYANCLNELYNFRETLASGRYLDGVFGYLSTAASRL